MTDSIPNETHAPMSTDNQEYAELIIPNYEGHYQKLLATIKEYAAAPRADVWSIAVGLADTGWLTAERESAYCSDIALLATQLVYIDLGGLGISPELARLILLARLLSDGAPINDLQKETNTAIADVIESLTAPPTAADTLPAKPLFPAHMWPITSADCAQAVAEAATSDEAATLAVAGLTADKWFSAMTTHGVA
jgi:hypothetical protein